MIGGRLFGETVVDALDGWHDINVTVGVDEIIFKVNSLNSISLSNGSKIKLWVEMEYADSGSSFDLYEIDSGDGKLGSSLGTWSYPIGTTDDSFEVELTLSQGSSTGVAFFSNTADDYELQWNGGNVRYFSTDIIDDPVMLLEYIKRNQNWLDNEDTALIKITGNGSFDDSELDELKALTIARQFHNYEDVWTDTLVKSICETFYLVSRHDSDGYECVEYLFNESTISDIITIDDIIPGTIGAVEEPNAENVFVEPFVNYGYDYGTSKFKSSLKITGVTENSEWSSSLTPGFTGNDGEAPWSKCRANYLKYRHVEKIQSNMTDQYWVVDYDTALWKITKMIDLMTKCSFSFSVHYEKGRNYYIGQHLSIQFPHETNDITIRSCIHKLSKHKQGNRVNVNVTLLEEVPVSFYYTKYQAADGSSTKWQDTDEATTKYQEV